jgi:hypothetical protein
MRRLGNALLFASVARGTSSRAVWRAPNGEWRRAIVREAASPNAQLELTARLRVTLGAEVGPAFFEAYGRDRRVLAWVEEDVGGLEFRELPRRSPALALRIARRMATAWCLLETRAPGQSMVLAPRRVLIDSNGHVRLLGRAVAPLSPREDNDDDDDALRVAYHNPDVDWLSPEAMHGQPRRPQSQIYAIGLMLYEAMTGIFPFETSNTLTFIALVLERGVPALTSDGPLAMLVNRCTAKNAAARFGSWSDFFAALEAAEASVEPFVPEPMAPVTGPPDVSAFASLDPGTLGPVDLVPLGPRDEDTITAPLPWMVGARTRPNADAWGTDARPMVRVRGLLVDARAVTTAEYARFVIATSRAAPSSWTSRIPPLETENAPITGITLADAKAYASWAGKRIPDSDEWERAILEAGVKVLTGEVWELTTDRAGADAWVVRGGRWRNHPNEAARPGNLSHSQVAPDVGFRCVIDA